MVWDTLYGVDIGLTPQPQMCAGQTVSADGLVWDFTLRDGLLFHDGTPVRGTGCCRLDPPLGAARYRSASVCSR